MEKRIYLMVNGNNFETIINEKVSHSDPRDTIVEYKVSGLGVIQVVKKFPFLNSSESKADIDYTLEISWEPKNLIDKFR